MSILDGKPRFTSWEGDFGRTGWKIQNKVTKLFVEICKLWWDMSTNILSPWLKNTSLSASASGPVEYYDLNIVHVKFTFSEHIDLQTYANKMADAHY